LYHSWPEAWADPINTIGEDCLFHQPKQRKVMHLKALCKPFRVTRKGLTKTLLIMKLTAIILLMACLQVSANGYSQQITINAKNTPLEKVFAEIEKQSGYQFFYKVTLVAAFKNVDVTIKDASLQQALTLVLRDQSLNYSIVGKTIVITKKEISIQEQTQDNVPLPIDVKGRVVNERGEPVEGVSVRVKGTKMGTSTDANGYFEIKGIDANATLSFTSVNMESFEIKVSGQTELVINLKTKITALGDVQIKINTGYQQTNRERFVGATGGLDSAAFHRQDGATGILARLDGTVAGLFFDKKSGGLNGIQIRGLSTINSNTSPLIILDNFPYNGDLNSINVNDVENVSVLKDAAAASIWGSRAGNGVIVITTKKGKYNQPLRISVSSNVTVQEKPDLYYYPQMSSSDFIDVEELLFNKGFYDADLSNTTYWPIVSPVVELLSKVRNGKMTQGEADAQINSMRSLDLRSDLNKYVYQPAITQQHYMNISGGTNNSSYLISGGYNRSRPNMQSSKPSEQYTINASDKIRPIKNLEIETGINFSQNTVRNPAAVLGNKIYPYAQLADAHGTHLAIPYQYRVAYLDTAGGGNLLDWKYRPLDELANADNTSIARFIKLNGSVAYRFTSWLSAEIKYQHITQKISGRNYQNLQTYFTRNLVNQFTNLSQSNPNLRNPLSAGGILDQNDGETNNDNYRAQININKSWKGKHNISALLAQEYSHSVSTDYYTRFYGYDNNIGTYQSNVDYITAYPTFQNITGGSRTIPNSTGLTNRTVSNLVSSLANISYTYNNRYTVYTSARRDGANVFGVNTNNKWKPLWSAGANWNIEKENFFSVKWVSSLRLRGSFGYTGNAGNGSGLPTIIYWTGSSVGVTNLPFASAGNAPNPNLRWEQVKTINAGVDFGLFDNRITGSFDFFNKKSTDLIAPLPFDPTSGVTTFTVNSASMGGNGFELNINSLNTKGKIEWRTNFGLSHAKMIVTQLYKGGFKASDFVSYGLNAGVGKIAYGLSSYKWAGLDPLTGDPRGYLNGVVSKDYTGIFNDDVNNQVFNGSSIPLYNGFIGNSVSYKNWTLSAIITFRLDYYFRRPTINYSSLFSNWTGNADYAKRWQQPGDEANTTVPSLIYPVPAAVSQRDAFYAGSEVNVLRGDNIKLQDVRLQYNLDRQAIKKLPVQAVQLFLYANNLNLILWRKNKSGLDPDFSGGFNPTLAPTPRTWTGGININF
jgi:TonB-linked SusC/RagA family outer membrane protein